ncbi:tetratricopeptide repeat protein [Streptomyces sp. NBC_00237]|uniref:tetratricopeptide repeat protein n=1 Tax=Streptomyces sp. NBC_00237 TaxID=2975687 RepID=UPI00224FF687|nr:tetratricopeptide repeat protein [Streptomyces sp. NBC_00237]MCX5203203.1 tetratricopeptide repeat protein [Streptomyces sp. NBC_00237]
MQVERSGDAAASGAYAVAISGHVSQMLLSTPPPSRPLDWPIRLGSVPALASAFQVRPVVRDRIDCARASRTKAVPAQVLSGGGGMGKTQLAAAYAHEAVRDGIDLVVWVDASDIEQVVARYAYAAHAVEAASDHLLGKSVESDAALFLQWLATTRRSWLVVLDDLTEPESMQRWWPPPSAYCRGRVVATTRRRDAALSGGGRAVVELGTYSAEEAGMYLQERLKSAHADHLVDPQAAVLTRALGFLPLALSHAAAYMVNEDVPCRKYLLRFKDSAARLDDLLPREADTEGYGRRVAAALLLSLDVAQASDPVGLAIPVMRLASVLDPAGHPRCLWADDAALHYLDTERATPSGRTLSAVSPTEAQGALRLLHRYGLLTDHARAGSRAVRMHGLTARAVRECTPDTTVPEVVKAASATLANLCDRVSRHDHETTTALLTNIDSLDRCAGDLMWQVDGHYVLRWAGRNMPLDTAVSYWQRLLGTSERQLGRAHALTLVARRDLAFMYFRGQRDKEAFAVLQEDFPYQEDRLALEQPQSAEAGRKDVSAAALLEDSVTVRQRILGWAHPATLTSQVDLALFYWSHGNKTAAVGLLERCLVGCGATFGPDHPYTISVDSRMRSWQDQRKRRWWRTARAFRRSGRS